MIEETKPTPASAEDGADKDGLIEKARSWLKEAREGNAEWRREAAEDFEFLAGHQWSDEDRRTLEDQRRPAIVFNRVAPIINAVAGTEINNRQEIRFIPREIGDVKVNEILTSAAQWLREEAGSEFVESDAFSDMLTCGMGWTEMRLDYETNPDGIVIEERVDPVKEMFWDPSAKKRNLEDRRFDIRVRHVPIDDATSMFPDADEADLHADWFNEEDVSSDVQPLPQDAYKDNDVQQRRKKVRLADIEWCERVPVYRVLDPSLGQIVDMEEAQFAVLRQRLGDGPKHVKTIRKKYRKAILGRVVLQGPSEIPYFTRNCVTGFKDKSKDCYFGLVRLMKDPQRWANKWLSQTLHIINSNAKGGLLIEEGAFVNPAKAEAEWSNPSSLTVLRSGALSQGKLQYKPAITFPAGMDRLMEFAISSIRDVSGVSLEMLGMAERDQPIGLEYQRKQSGLTILAHLFDGLRIYRKQKGKALLYYIQNFLSDGRLIRIVGKGKEEYIPLVRDQTIGEYDVIVDEAPTSPNQKDQTFSALMQLTPMLAKLGMSPPPEALDYIPLPSSLIEAWRNHSAMQQQAAQQRPDPEQVKMQHDAQLKQFDMEMKRIDAGVKEREAAIKLEELRIKEMELNANMQMRLAEIKTMAQVAPLANGGMNAY